MGSLAVIVAGAVSAVVMIVVGIAFSMATSPVYGAQPELWKPVNELWYTGTILLYILSGLVYALVYSVLGRVVKGGTFDKGLLYGSLLWFVGPLPGMLMLHILTTLDTTLIVAWLLQWLLNVLASGIITAYVFELTERGREDGGKNIRSGRKRAGKA
jgi:predicted outer membrane lipoprotein